MEKFETITALVAPMDRANIDTETIIPKQFLKSSKRTGFSQNLCDECRYLYHVEPGMDSSQRKLNPAFVLNLPRYQGVQILLARANFGCGSSREHAPWSLQDYGFRVIIAPSFADIFFNNCYKIGLLPVVLDAAILDYLFEEVKSTEGYRLTVDLQNQKVISPKREEFTFEIDIFRKQCLLNGLDDIGLTLQHAEKINQFEQKRRNEQPWLFM